MFVIIFIKNINTEGKNTSHSMAIGEHNKKMETWMGKVKKSKLKK